MNVIIFHKLSTCSKRAMLKTKKRYGRKYYYWPRSHLVSRLVFELGWSKEAVINQMLRERQFLLQNGGDLNG